MVDDVTTEAMTYGYDTAGQLTSADRTTGAHPDRSWAYDSVGRRTDACEGDTAIACTGGTLSTYTYDNAGWLTTETVGSDYSVDWVYDEAGRRDTGTVNVSGTGDIETRVYTYDDAGALTDITGTDLAASTQSFHFGYKRTGTGVVYGTESVTGAGVDNVGGVVWDPSEPIAQIAVATLNDGTPVLYGYDRDRKILTGSNFYRLEADGSTIADPDSTGAAAGFDPYGRPDDTPDHTILGYRSELQYHAAYTIGGTDLTAELIYLRARDYDPQTGTFLTPDVLDGVDGTPVVANAWQYGDNDPINRTDPSGLRVCDASLQANDSLMVPQAVGGRTVGPIGGGVTDQFNSAVNDISRCAQQLRDTARCSGFDAEGRPNCPEVWNECVGGQIATLSNYKRPGVDGRSDGPAGAAYYPEVDKSGLCLGYGNDAEDPLAFLTRIDIALSSCLPSPGLAILTRNLRFLVTCASVGQQGGHVYGGLGTGTPGLGVAVGVANADACDRDADQVSIGAAPYPTAVPGLFVGSYAQASTDLSDADTGIVAGTPGFGASYMRYWTLGCK